MNNTTEYQNQTDGLLYCSKCHAPKQTRIVILDREFTPSIMCLCEQEQFRLEKEKRKQQEYFSYVSQLKSAGLQDAALRTYTFSNDLGYNPEIEKAHIYVNQWNEMSKNASGFLLWGDVGTGKSFFAGCIANALIDKGVPVLMTNFTRILNTLTGMFSEDRNRFIRSFDAYSLLIIDDLGVERNSEFSLEQVFSVIDGRYRSKKPLIITTNLTLQELKNPSDTAHARIYDRVLEMCIPLKINNQNIRKLNAAAHFTEAKKLFTDDSKLQNIVLTK